MMGKFRSTFCREHLSTVRPAHISNSSTYAGAFVCVSILVLKISQNGGNRFSFHVYPAMKTSKDSSSRCLLGRAITYESIRSGPIYGRSHRRKKVKPQLFACFDLSTMPISSSNCGPISRCSRNEDIIFLDSASQCTKVVPAPPSFAHGS